MRKLDVPYREATAESCLSQTEELGDIDLVPISPIHYTKNAAAAQAIRPETFILLTSRNDKSPSLTIVRVGEEAQSTRMRLPTTLVVCLKSSNMA